MLISYQKERGLTITDVMAAQGMVQSKAPLGFALFLAKVGVQDPQFAIEGLLNYAMALDNPTLNKLSEETRLQIIPYLVNFAFADYSRSAASKARCEHCAGTGFHNVLREVVKHSRSGESVIKEEWVSRLAWLLTVIYSAVPLAYLCGIYPYSSWATIVANIIFLSVLVAVRGNVARLVDHLRH
ncbi:TPA: hypothetical protein JL425_001333 [Escherichia coli]|nr:hypothetical protein [Escherichia coli]HAW6172953.1 hypothetical protein [Escherichia coli]HAW6203312.1 hypothetical protein [Escherichia coli]HBA2843095.1 hypothetical protein [Escherichia coli]HBA3025164.1 hypothetical protein [Escherichia coli]